MKCTCCLPAIGIAAIVAGSLALAQPATKDTKPAQPGTGQPIQPQLPPGMSEADMKACEEAGTPGPAHAELAKRIGVWTCKATMWMTPDAPPAQSENTTTFTSFLDGRFVRCEVAGDMMGMPFNGFGLYGFDNVAQEYQAFWVDSYGTGMMIGTGNKSADGKTFTWTYAYNCPIAKGPVKFRQVETITGANTMKMEMYGPDAKTGKEFKMLEVAYTRKAGTTGTTSPTGSR